MGTLCSVTIISTQWASSVLRLSPQKVGKFGKFGKFDAGPAARTAVVGNRRGQARAGTPDLHLSEGGSEPPLQSRHECKKVR